MYGGYNYGMSKFSSLTGIGSVVVGVLILIALVAIFVIGII